MVVSYLIGSNLNYAKVQELGKTITVGRGRLMSFQIDGRWVRTRRVVIPARPFLRPAMDATRVEAVATVGKVFEKLVLARHYSGA